MDIEPKRVPPLWREISNRAASAEVVDVTNGSRSEPASNDLESAPRITLIDQHTLSREGISRLLADWFDAACVSEFESLAAAEADAGRLGSANLTVIVIRPGAVRIDEVLARLQTSKLQQRHCPIVLLSEHWEMPDVRAALAQGVSGCIPLLLPFKIVAAALQLVMEGGRYVPEQVLMSAVPPPELPQHIKVSAAPMTQIKQSGFTPQEHKVLSALLEGKPNKRIARDLDLCESTVKVHVRHIMRKLAVTNRTQVALRLINTAPPEQPEFDRRDGIELA
jgi:two-component system, NarL family, nitrate/nitrite response regulator NarL